MKWLLLGMCVLPVAAYGQIENLSDPQIKLILSKIEPAPYAMLGEPIYFTVQADADHHPQFGFVRITLKGENQALCESSFHAEKKALCIYKGKGGLGLGEHVFVAEYTGDQNTAPSRSAEVSYSILGRTQTVLYARQPVVTEPSKAFIEVRVSPLYSSEQTPQGSVVFKEKGQILSQRPLTEARAFFPISELSPGRHVIGAAYLGDKIHAPSVSELLIQSVAYDAKQP